MISHTNAVGGKTAGASDNCIKKWARRYCAADDAFLCQSCNGFVHSANPLAQSHVRVCLKTGSAVPNKLHQVMIVDTQRTKRSRESSSSSQGSWHKWFSKKPRMPRSRKNVRDKKVGDRPAGNPFPLVPEVGGDETSNEEIDRDEFILYRVPAYDPFFSTELCNSKERELIVNNFTGEIEAINSIDRKKGLEADLLDNLQVFFPSDSDLTEFATDVESFLGRGLDNECFGIEELGLMDSKDDVIGDASECSLSSSGQAGVKFEEEVDGIVDEAREREIDISNDTFKLRFNCNSTTKEDKGAIKLEEVHDIKVADEAGNNDDANNKRKMILRLNYEGVITAWESQGCPWTNGNLPELNHNDYWPDWMGLWGPESQNGHFEEGNLCRGGHTGIEDAGREAKVSRYREKRRTRLFSKKIRYEVRKLNAEKRPRMKGRFVKRAPFAPPPCPSLTK